jgi:4-amino-4-deoxy-L-arabinose transferase-like glycosyltransferase
MRSNPLRWLLLAGAIHITLTLAIFLVGHFQLVPGLVDSYGTVGANPSLPIDSTAYRNLSSQLANELQANGVSAWLAIKAPLHCRFYSLLFATAGRLLGHNILAAEPLNVVYYLGVLVCVYCLGRELFNTRAGLLASFIAGAWPTFLVQSTQLIRDSLSILCLLALVLLLTLLLTRALSWRVGLASGLGGAALLTFFWVIRGNMWNVVILAIGVAIVLLALRMIRVSGFIPGNVIAITLVLIAMLLVPPRFESTSLYGKRLTITPLSIPSGTQPAQTERVFTRAIKQIGERRAGFRSYRAHESDVDADVRLATVGDMLKYVPRAAVVGFFAPFPRMWFERGNYGRAGRLLTGAETLAMYFLYAAAGVCFWRHRRELPVWLLSLVAALGTIALGLVVVNAGALYRLRYVFWILFIVMAAESLVHFTVLRTNSTKSRMSSSVVSNDDINRHSDVSSFQT